MSHRTVNRKNRRAKLWLSVALIAIVAATFARLTTHAQGIGGSEISSLLVAHRVPKYARRRCDGSSGRTGYL